jgi:rubredoxin
MVQHDMEIFMRSYRCLICGYVYEEELGDPDSGIAPGTRWADVPADWVCPLCGADKKNFESID